MSENIRHYNVDKLDLELRELVENNKLTGPCFVGQGITEYVGSDSYGYYIVSKTERANGKIIWGISRAAAVMHGSWTEGTMDCSIDLNTAKPDEWVTKWGNDWYMCSEFGTRTFKCKHRGWNGAYQYRDPSL